MPSGWSGYGNGKIPLSMLTQLVPILGAGGYAQTDAARAYQAMAAEFERAIGVPLKFVEANRTYDTQVELFTERYTRVNYVTGLYWDGSYWVKKAGVAAAAIPGTSNHGEALAYDFASPLTSWTTPGQAWFRANEARFGFSSAQGIADGEPWHKVYIGPTPTTKPASGGATPLTETENDVGIPYKATSSSDLVVAGWIYLMADNGIIRCLGPLAAGSYAGDLFAAHPNLNSVDQSGPDLMNKIKANGMWEYTGDPSVGPVGLTGLIIGRRAPRSGTDRIGKAVRHYPDVTTNHTEVFS